MNSNLMCSSCEEVHLEKAIFIMIVSEIPKFCLCYFWIDWILCCHFLSVMRMSSDKRFYISIFPMYLSDDKGEICFLDGSFCYFELECMHGFIIFCDDDNSTRIFIEAMDDTRSFDSVDYRFSRYCMFCSFSHRE